MALTLPIASLIIFLAFTLFKDQKKVLAEANERANFAASVSHELRTPLTNLQLYADLIRNKMNRDTSGTGQLTEQDAKEVAKKFAALTMVITTAGE